MTIDEIVQTIYEERYVDPKSPETAAYMRDGMIRNVECALKGAWNSALAKLDAWDTRGAP